MTIPHDQKTCTPCKGTGFRDRSFAKLPPVNCHACAGVGTVYKDAYDQKEFLRQDAADRREDMQRWGT